MTSYRRLYYIYRRGRNARDFDVTCSGIIRGNTFHNVYWREGEREREFDPARGSFISRGVARGRELAEITMTFMACCRPKFLASISNVPSCVWPTNVVSTLRKRWDPLFCGNCKEPPPLLSPPLPCLYRDTRNYTTVLNVKRDSRERERRS